MSSRLSMDTTGLVTLRDQVNFKNKYRLVVCIDHAVRDYFPSFWDDLLQNPEDEAILPTLFQGFDWPNLPKPWAAYPDIIRKGIHKGRGLPPTDFNRYMMQMGLNAHLLEVVDDVI